MLACTGLLVTACAVVFLRYGTYQFLVRNLGWDNAWTQTIFMDDTTLQHYEAPRNIPADEVPIDWAARYPFKEASSIPPKKESRLKKAEQKFHEQAGKFEAWTNRRFYSYMHLVESMCRYQGLIGWNIPIYDDYVSPTELPDGHLTKFMKKKDVSIPIQQTVALADFCQSNSIPFLVVLAPNNNASNAPYEGKLDFSNENGDVFLTALQAKGIRCLDLRPILDEQVENHLNLFFRTDHHWKPDVARAAVQSIANILNTFYGYQMDVSLLNAENFHEDIYPSRYLGTFGQKFTTSRTQPDDFPLIYPNFPVTFQLQIPSMELDRTGDFSIVYDYRQLESKDLRHALFPTYMYGERALISIQNLQKTDHHKLLLVRDSFGNMMIPFLALGMEKIDAIDMRFFTGSLQSYIQKEQPDTVVLCYTISEFNWSEAYPRSLFNFN